MGYMRPRMPEANDHGVHFADTDTNTDHHVPSLAAAPHRAELCSMRMRQNQHAHL